MTLGGILGKACKKEKDDGNLMEDPRLLGFLLNHLPIHQSKETPPTITAHPYRPTAKSVMYPPQVCWTLSPMITSLLSLSDDFHMIIF